MYDFYFADKTEVLDRLEDYLIFCKRLLPRWVNGIPDSECIAIWRTLNTLNRDQAPILVETGCGASSIALFLYAALNDGKLFSWDTNGSKGSFLKSVVSETIGKLLEVDINKIWTFVPFSSTDIHAGIKVLPELGFKPVYGFFDSWHVLDHLKEEIKQFNEVSSQTSIIALDDAYYACKYYNYGYTNMIRVKLGLPKIEEPKDNICNPFYEEIENYLINMGNHLSKIEDDYKKLYKEDIFFGYYEGDREFINKIGMENKNKLEHRFDAWKVRKK